MASAGNSIHFIVCVLSFEGSHLVSHFDRTAVVVGVLGVVGEAVIDNQVEVRLEFIHRAVTVLVNSPPHRREVHWSLDHVQIVGHLGQRQAFSTV